MTINSSVGLESVLWGVPVTVLGDTSYAFLLEARDNRALLARLAFYLYGYLVPRQALFDLAYLRFRLTQPSEARIVAYHLQFHVPDHDAAGPTLKTIHGALSHRCLAIREGNALGLIKVSPAR